MRETADYELSTSKNEGIVEIWISGHLSIQTMEAVRQDLIEIIRENDAKAVLCDVREATGPHEILDAYQRPRRLPIDIKLLPIAIVDVPENMDFKSFFEITAANTGMVIKWFTDIESARAWIKNKLAERGKT